MMQTPFDIISAPPTDRIARLFGEMTSRTEDDFIHACAAVGVARRLAQDAATIKLLSQLGDRLEALAAIQRALRLPSAAVIDLGGVLQDMCGHMAEARFADRGIFIQVRTDAIPMDGRKAWAVLVIISELLLNTHRRGFRGEPGLISVEAGEKDGVVTCRLRDDGSAARYLEAEEMRIGRSSLAMLAHEVGASLDYLGTGVLIRIPPAPLAQSRLFDRFRAAFPWIRSIQ